MEVRISARRSNVFSSPKPTPAFGVDDLQLTFDLPQPLPLSRLPTGVRKCLPRLMVATRSLRRPSRIFWSSARLRLGHRFTRTANRPLAKG